MDRHRFRTQFLVALIVALSVCGAWISGGLLKQDADVWGTGGMATGLFARICRATERVGFSCGNEDKGAWSDLRVPVPLLSRDSDVAVPVAFLGLAYFVFMGMWFALIRGPRPLGRRWHRLIGVAAFLGSLGSVFYVGLMALGHAQWCFWCLATHAVNFAMVLAIWRLYRGHGAARDESEWSPAASPEQVARMTLTFREAAGAVVCATVLIASLWVYRSDHLFFQKQRNRLLAYRTLVRGMQEDPAFLLREHLAQPRHEIARRPGEAPAGDRPELVVFTDFECPSCTWNARAVRDEAIEAFGGELVVRIRHYPLCRDCNEHVTSEFHPNSCNAAYAAEAARLQGGDEAYWQMHDLLFRHSNELGNGLYADLAARIGLDADVFAADMAGEAVREIVRHDVAAGYALGIIGTPALYLNGREIPPLCQTSSFWEAAAENWSASREGYRTADAGTPTPGAERGEFEDAAP